METAIHLLMGLLLLSGLLAALWGLYATIRYLPECTVTHHHGERP
jgi:hypothetical protein